MADMQINDLLTRGVVTKEITTRIKQNNVNAHGVGVVLAVRQLYSNLVHDLNQRFQEDLLVQAKKSSEHHRVRVTDHQRINAIHLHGALIQLIKRQAVHVKMEKGEHLSACQLNSPV